jgi:hypothetical protein
VSTGQEPSTVCDRQREWASGLGGELRYGWPIRRRRLAKGAPWQRGDGRLRRRRCASYVSRAAPAGARRGRSPRLRLLAPFLSPRPSVPARNRQPRARYECQHPPPAIVHPAPRRLEQWEGGGLHVRGDVSSTTLCSHVLNRAVAA